MRHLHAAAASGRVLALVALLSAVTTAAFAQTPPGDAAASPSSAPWTPVTSERLHAPGNGDWVNYRRTHDVTGFSPLTQIDRDNVAQLRTVWGYSMRDTLRWVPTPVVANGLMYLAEGSGRVLAFDVLTGEVVWTHIRDYPKDIGESEAYPRHRGVSIFEDTILWGTADSFLVALDARTGAKRWEVQTGDYHTGEGHAHPPLIADGKVFIGAAGGDFAARGKFQAFDARDGKHLWTFYTAPREGEPGFKTWTDNGKWPPNGGAAWNTASYDADLNLVYFSTGQPSPWTTASRGPGDSLYSNTLLAVDADTGKLRWHFQLVPADEWDRSGYEGMLVDLEIGGKMRKAVITTGKIGWGVVLDRATGEFLHAFKTAYDNVITGWTRKGRPIFDPSRIPKPEDVDSGKVFEICPHIHGARNLQAPAFSPLTKYYYLGVNNSCMTAQVVTPIFQAVRGITGVTYTATLPPGYDYVGEFVAFDPVKGTRAWTYKPESGAPMTASALATAGGLVFGGTADRQLFALHSETGELLWQTRLNGDISGAPITFEVDGKQYLAVASGGRVAQTTTLGRLVGVDVPQGSSAIWVFALPDATPRTVPRPVRRDLVTRSTNDGVYSADQAARGEQIYTQECTQCHVAANYVGTNFTAKWGDATLGDLYQDISLAMPPTKPGGLTPDSYASIVAFFMSRSGYPAEPTGRVELPGDARALGAVRIEAPPTQAP